jgi:hypothetical protein
MSWDDDEYQQQIMKTMNVVTTYLKALPCYSLHWVKESLEISTLYSQFLLLFVPHAQPKDHEVVESPGP